ncbi:GGDEF domain-containing protein [Levilactobacillus brevis]|uniref:GGDEF domain-containing protein n=1 Tax=Levilactobacillus brevis TaxID=1580 RepID=UPI0021652885|nr:GGDEF domain-containing protein [Levilactobacillus brevis]UVW18557.1 GGDEF domain-containing protein [Levilactobacillus brevis]
MSWTMWLVPPIITSIFFVLGVITLYWSIFTWATTKAESQSKPVNVQKVQIVVGTICAIISVFALQLLVRDSHLGWTFVNFQLLLLLFVAYFLQLKIPYWLVFVVAIGFMLMNGNVTAPLSWVFTLVFVGFYVVAYQHSIHLWRWPYPRYILVALNFGMVLWLLVKMRFHLPWVTYWIKMADYAFLATLMYGYFKIQDKDRRIKDRLFQSANWDALTHVQNYAAYDRAIDYHFSRSLIRHNNLTMAMFDIDHFKCVNDTYGHLAGDEVLKQVSSTVVDVLKAKDEQIVLYRTGGEEFNVIFPGYTVAQAQPLVQEFFDRVKALRIPYNDVELNVTISVGVSSLHRTDHNPLDFYKRVDSHLYRSKKMGRQQITLE